MHAAADDAADRGRREQAASASGDGSTPLLPGRGDGEVGEWNSPVEHRLTIRRSPSRANGLGEVRSRRLAWDVGGGRKRKRLILAEGTGVGLALGGERRRPPMFCTSARFPMWEARKLVAPLLVCC